MGLNKVSKILCTALKKIPVDGGDVCHVLKKDAIGFIGFGEAYISQVFHRSIKGWKLHKKMTMNLVVPEGAVKFVFFDGEGNSRVEVIGEQNYQRLTVPPGIWFGFQGLSEKRSLVLNIADLEHDPNEVIRKKISEIDYDWELY